MGLAVPEAMLRAAFAGVVATLTVIVGACADPHVIDDQGPRVTRCTLIGCGDVVTANFVDLLAVHGSALPLTVETCLDQHCVSATVQLGTSGGDGCLAGKQGTACCTFDPPAPGTDCWAELGRDVLVFLPVPDDGAFAGAVHTVKAKVRGQGGEVLVSGEQATTLAMSQPNGPECEPICFQGSVDFAAQ